MTSDYRYGEPMTERRAYDMCVALFKEEYGREPSTPEDFASIWRDVRFLNRTVDPETIEKYRHIWDVPADPDEYYNGEHDDEYYGSE